MADPVKNPVGRPSEYKPEYCEMLIEHMAKGLSFEAFAGVLRCCKQTLYTWLEKHPDFVDAKKQGTESCRLFWENIATENMISNNGKSLNSAVWIFNMKNRFRDEWRERQEVETTGTNEIKIVIDKDDEKL